MREKINWRFIEFSDNQKCIELIESRLGILSLLDEVRIWLSAMFLGVPIG